MFGSSPRQSKYKCSYLITVLSEPLVDTATCEHKQRMRGRYYSRIMPVDKSKRRMTFLLSMHGVSRISEGTISLLLVYLKLLIMLLAAGNDS